MAKRVTGPVPIGVLVKRALWLANAGDTLEPSETYRALKVLPDRAAYLLDNNGNVYAKAVRISRRAKELEAQRKVLIGALNRMIEGTAPAVGRAASKVRHVQRIRGVDGPEAASGRAIEIYSELVKIIRVDFSFAGAYWWRRQSLARGKAVDDQLVIAPTLPALIGAALTELWTIRGRIRKCAAENCGNYFLVGSDPRIRITCSMKCQSDHALTGGRVRAKRMRDRDRSNRRGHVSDADGRNQND